MDYTEYSYLYPPRPDAKVPQGMLGFYEKRGWIAQVKKNGTCTVIFAHKDKVIFKTRHGDDDEDEDESSAAELTSPYVDEGTLDLEAWTHDALILSLPEQILCQPDCLGLCPVCGESLNGADPADHDHGQNIDPRWAKLRDLK